METAIGTRNPQTGLWTGGQATEWMTDYCDELKTQLQAAGLSYVPIRFHFDMEASMFGGSMNNAILHTMIACENDPAGRWATVPVPGFNGQTMYQLWEQAKADYGWGAPGLSVTLASKLNIGSNDNRVIADHPTNRPYVMWWLRICSVATAAAMEIAAEAPIKAAWPNANVLVSNYDYMTMDMGLDTFSHRKATQNATTTTREFWRGGWSRDTRGAYPFIVASSVNTAVKPLVWQMGEGFNSHDFDAPVLYYFDYSENVNWSLIRHNKWYEPPVNGVHPAESWAEMCRRQHRHLLDSIFATPTRAANGVAPWVAFPGEHKMDNVGTGTTIDESRRTLALLRSKNIREVILWGNKQPSGRGDAGPWNEFKRADMQVYSPQVYEVADVRGNWVEGDIASLNVTLRDVSGVENDYVIQAEPSGTPGVDVTETIVWFEGIDPNEMGHDARIVLECSVNAINHTEAGTNWRSQIRGEIALWQESTQSWIPAGPINLDSGVNGEYRFYVADKVNGVASNGATSTRREFDLSGIYWDGLCDFITNHCTTEGLVGIKLTHLAPSLPSGFESRYDLVMLYPMDAPWQGGGASGAASGPESGGMSAAGLGGDEGAAGEQTVAERLPGRSSFDYNYDGVVDAADLALFTAAWTANSPGGDYNGDGVVESLDLTQFLAGF
jgi:hypothetical protein